MCQPAVFQTGGMDDGLRVLVMMVITVIMVIMVMMVIMVLHAHTV